MPTQTNPQPQLRTMGFLSGFTFSLSFRMCDLGRPLPTSTTYSSSWYASVHILPNIKAHTFDKCSKSCHQLQSSTPNSSLSQIWLTLTLSTPLVSKYHMNAISFCSPPNVTSFTYQEAFRVHSAPVCLGK